MMIPMIRIMILAIMSEWSAFLMPAGFALAGFSYTSTVLLVWQNHGKIHYEKMKNNVTYVYICIYSTLNVTISGLEDYQTLFLERD